ncbi:unnamed protein product [Ambrosiozyma monospora]|uniref:Unnamed protein product n=1 Tax=Ambrosiozyma monospora TaxID=43982 RepID=A0ACB5T4L5_AMBMO|nr:unnamed protein product [Ambrosiozyma monospora]
MLKCVKERGVITVPEIAYDTEYDDFQFDLQFDKQDEETRVLIRKDLIPQLRKQLADFGNVLITVHGSDIQVDEAQVQSKLTKENQQKNVVKSVVTEKTTFNKGESKKPTTSSSSSKISKSNVPKYNTSKVHLSPTFHTTAEQLYLTLLQPERVAAWTRSPPLIKPEEGAEFHLFGGNIEGKILKLVPNKKIEKLWRLRDWKEGHYAHVTIDLIQGDGETKMDVTFDGVPIGDEELVENNFNSYYVRSIMVTFGFGAIL